MASYYYLVASLPRISLMESPPLALDEFRADCRKLLTEKDFAELELVFAGRIGEGKSSFLRAWADADTQIRNTATKIRASKIGVDARRFLHPYDGCRVWLDQEIANALSQPNPLEREAALDMVRWNFCEEIARLDAFGLSGVLSFAVRLMMATRWAALKEDVGIGRLESLVVELEENAAQRGAVSFK